MVTAMNATSTFSCPHNGTAHDGTLLCHWTNSPGARGTLNIFWLCISTLGLCVWNAVHPDVPRPRTPGWRVFGKRLWWLFVGLFMPEMLVLVALAQLRQACKLLVNVYKDARCPTEFPWWMYLVKSWRPEYGHTDSATKRWMKALLRWMDRLLAHNSPRPRVSDPAASNCAREQPWTLTHSFYAVMSGFVDEKGHAIAAGVVDDCDEDEDEGADEGEGQDQGNGSKSVFQRIDLPVDDRQRIPDVSVQDIEDRGKAGILAKSLLIWQLFVFLANCFARWHQSLPLSLLEITTISHSLCSIIAMVLWWYKPHSIGEATVIGRKGPLPSLPASNVAWRKVFSWSFLGDSLRAGVKKVMVGYGNIDVPRTLTIIAIAVLYGLPHLLGLSVHFPTAAEQLCWEIATFTVIGSPLVACALLWIDTHKLGRMEKAGHISLVVLLLILLVLYLIASMFLVGESVRQIFALPVESFREPQLTTYLPSFS